MDAERLRAPAVPLIEMRLPCGAALACGAVSLSALSSASATAQQRARDVSGSLTMWVYPLIAEPGQDEQLWDDIIQSFGEEYPDVDVTVEVQPWERRVEKLTTAMAAGVGPDVWYINEEDVPNHAKSGRLVPLDDALSEEAKAEYFPEALKGLTYDGTLYAVPILMGVTSLFYNTEVFERAGVTTFPETWDQLMEVGPAFQDQGDYLTQFNAGSAQAEFYPLLWQAGGQAFDEDGSPAFNSPEGVEALTFAVTLVQQGYAPESAATAENIPITETPLGQGEVAVGNGVQSSGLKQLSDAWGEGALRIGAPLMHKEQAAYGTVAGYAVAESSENKDPATVWVQYITSPDVMTKINTTSGYFAPLESVRDIHADDPILGQLENHLPLVRATPTILGGRQVLEDALEPEIQAAVLGEKTPQQALDDAAERARQIIQEQSEQ